MSRDLYNNLLLYVFLLIFAFIYKPGIVSASASSDDLCALPANAIVIENCKAGTSDWHIEHIQGDIEGFASVTSVMPGQPIDFYVNTSADKFSLSIYRSGYYGGKGGRLIHKAENIKGVAQPACQFEHSLGLVDCSNWSKSYQLMIPKDWVSGVYIAKLSRADTGGENYIVFVVKEETPRADIVMQLSVTTYQAYNFYGNKSAYTSISFDYCPTVTQAARAAQVSFDRPNSLGAYNQNTYFWTDYPMVYWLEAQGYDVGYITNIDTHRFGFAQNTNDLLKHHVFVSMGHDEYWSQEMRDAITAARDHGVQLAFFSSNVSYWRIRLEPNQQTGEADRIMAVYKTTESGPPDPSGHPTTTWRDPAGVNDPENALIGIQYVGDNDLHYFPLQVTSEQAQDRLYRNTPLQNMPPNSTARIGKHLIGWEWDAATDNGHTPASLDVLAESPTSGSLLADAGRTYNYGTAHADVTRYTAPHGSLVFSAGTNQWSWGLAIYEPNSVIQQITYNLFSDMGVQPATPATELKLDIVKSIHSSTWQASVERDPLMSSALESYMRSWAVSDFALAVQADPAFMIYKSSESKTPVVSNIQSQAKTDSVTISWDTDQPASSQVWLKVVSGPVDWRTSTEAPGALPVAGEVLHEALVTHHEVTFSELLPNVKYFFQIASTNANGQSIVSAEKGVATQNGGGMNLQAKKYVRPLYRQFKCGLVTHSQTLIMVAFIVIVGSAVLIRRRWSRHGLPGDKSERALF